jgi:hydroxymethylpyrimidine pyrophosphatase-like HAD family hydrolase
MFFVALATDYDGTIAEHGIVTEATCKAIEALKRSGRRAILVTGRELPDLLSIFPQIGLFDLVVAENGALLYDPATQKEEPLAPPPPPEFVARLEAARVTPLSVGRSIVATWEPNETIVLETIRELGLELQIIFNKGAVMVLPANVNKASGLAAGLERLGLSPHNVVGIGDAENDHAFLSYCGFGVAVDNALSAVKDKVDYVTKGARGEGARELIELLDDTDLRDIKVQGERALPLLGTCGDGSDLRLDPRDGPMLIAGSSGGGKSTVVRSFIEQMHRLNFQFCVIDPEGDYAELVDAVVLGDAGQPPRIEEVMDLLSRPGVSVVVNLLGVKIADRPRFFAKMLPDLAAMRAHTGRPHWIVVDEAHHMLPADWDPAPVTLPREMPAIMLVTVHPEALAPDVVSAIESVIGVGKHPREAVKLFCEARGEPEPPELEVDREAGEAYYWQGGKAQIVRIEQPKGERRRHVRKYAEGELGEDKSFYFRGPENALNLRAQNLMIFLQMAEGVDEATWLHHLREGDYSRWFEEAIKDDELADEARAVEADSALDAATSREKIAEMVTRRYTAPAKAGD